MLDLFNRTDYAEALEQAQNMNEADFLGGPGRDEDDIEIDQIFAGTLKDALDALSTDANIPLEDNRSSLQDSWDLVGTSGKYEFRIPIDTVYEYEPGVVAIDSETGEIIGAYVGCSLAVSLKHQSCGLGISLVMLRFLTESSLPLWDHDKPGYSPRGASVHRSALAELKAMKPLL